MPRRRLLAAVIAAACAVGLAACSLPGADPYGQTVKQSQLVTTTKPGTGHVASITWNLPYEPLTVDAAHSFNYAENTVIANMCESLLRMTPGFSTSPALATKVTEPDALTQVYTIRPGVTFWDGTPMTAQDVAYSLNRNLDPKVGSYFANYYENVASITATGPDEVTVRFSRPDALFESAMATAAGAVMERAFTQKAGDSLGTPGTGVMCTGPFRFGTWQPGRQLELERNAHYWDAALQPHVDRIDFSFIADESTAVNALRSGEVDGQYFYLPPAGLIQLQKDDQLQLSYGKSLVFFSLIAANAKGPLGDPRVRRALSDIIDRSAIASVVFQGAALPAATLTGPDYWGYEKDEFAAAAEKYSTKTDVAQAKALLKQVGHIGPITIGIQGSSAVHEQTANVIQAAGKQLGLDIRTKVIPVEQYGNLYNDPKARQGLDGFFTTWYGNIPDPIDVYAVFLKGGPNNYGDYNTVNDQVQAALATTDPAARAKEVVKIESTVTADAPWLPLVTLPTILVQNSRITGATASMAYLYYPWAAAIGAKEK